MCTTLKVIMRYRGMHVARFVIAAADDTGPWVSAWIRYESSTDGRPIGPSAQYRLYSMCVCCEIVSWLVIHIFLRCSHTRLYLLTTFNHLGTRQDGNAEVATFTVIIKYVRIGLRWIKNTPVIIFAAWSCDRLNTKTLKPNWENFMIHEVFADGRCRMSIPFNPRCRADLL